VTGVFLLVLVVAEVLSSFLRCLHGHLSARGLSPCPRGAGGFLVILVVAEVLQIFIVALVVAEAVWIFLIIFGVAEDIWIFLAVLAVTQVLGGFPLSSDS